MAMTETSGYLQIGEAAERTGLTQRTLRYYEEKGLLAPPSRLDGGFRLYSDEDIGRIEQIKRLKELLGFSLAEIKEIMSAEDVRLQIRSGWRRDADASEKAEKLSKSREVTLRQLALVDQKVDLLQQFRQTLTERLDRYAELLARWEAESAAN